MMQTPRPHPRTAMKERPTRAREARLLGAGEVPHGAPARALRARAAGGRGEAGSVGIVGAGVSIGPLRPDDEAYTAELRQEFPLQGLIPEAERRAITLRQLLHVAAFAARRATPEAGPALQWHDTAAEETSSTATKPLTMERLNFYHLDAWLIRPATKAKGPEHPGGYAFVELLAAGPQEPAWFVSHWWGERLVDFVRCVELHAETRELPDGAGFWALAYAVRRHSPQDLGTEDSHGPAFRRALGLCEGVLMILNSKTEHAGPAMFFKRAWCVFEEAVALEANGRARPALLDIATSHGLEAQLLTDGLTERERRQEEKSRGEGRQLKTERESAFPITIIDEGLSLRVEKAEATQTGDRVHILNCLTGQAASLRQPSLDPRAYAKVNRKLRAALAVAVWRQAVEKNAVESLRLPEVLAQDEERANLSLDVSYTAINGIGVCAIAKGIPIMLQRLHLKFLDCDEVDNAALATLASRLPPVLEDLGLDFGFCDRIGDSGIAALARALPDALQGLSLSLAACGEIGDPGLAALAQGLPMGLQRADISLQECSKITDRGLAAFARTNAVVLRRLHLDFRKCEHVTSAGLAALARRGHEERAAVDGVQAPRKGEGRKLVLHFALPRTLMTCDMAAHRSTQDELNCALSELAWGRAAQGVGWALASREPTPDPPEPGLCSYGDYLRRLFPADPCKAEQKQAAFTQEGEPGRAFRQFFDRMVKSLSYSNNWCLATAYGIKTVVMKEEEVPEDPSEPEQAIMRFGRHQVLPSFWQLLIHLTKQGRNFSMVLRSYSPKQLAVVQRELQFFCKGVHPAYSGQNKTKVPPRMNGDKGSRDYRLRDANIGRMDRTNGRLRFAQGATPGGEADQQSGRDGAAPYATDEDEDEEHDGHVHGADPVVYNFPPLHGVYNGLVHNVLAKARMAAIIDDFAHWETYGKQATAGKLHIVDHNGCLAEMETQHLFFDGSARPGDAHSVDVRDLNSGEPLSMAEADGLFLHRVDLYQACTDVEYFVKALEACENKMTQRALRAHGAVDAGTCLPLSQLDLSFQECVELGDSGLAALAQSLPRTLQSLSLNLNCCFRLGDAGLAALAQSLPRELRELRLSLGRCTKLGSEGVSALVERLPLGLRSLSLDLQRCYGVKDPSIACIKRGLPPGLKHLELNIQHTEVSDARKQQCWTLEDLQRWQPSSADFHGASAIAAAPAEPEERVAAPAKPAEPIAGLAPQAAESAPKPKGRRRAQTILLDTLNASKSGHSFATVAEHSEQGAGSGEAEEEDGDASGSSPSSARGSHLWLAALAASKLLKEKREPSPWTSEESPVHRERSFSQVQHHGSQPSSPKAVRMSLPAIAGPTALLAAAELHPMPPLLGNATAAAKGVLASLHLWRCNPRLPEPRPRARSPQPSSPHYCTSPAMLPPLTGAPLPAILQPPQSPHQYALPHPLQQPQAQPPKFATGSHVPRSSSLSPRLGPHGRSRYSGTATAAGFRPGGAREAAAGCGAALRGASALPALPHSARDWRSATSDRFAALRRAAP